ncbi:MAG: DUF1343 domain-containing protein, partial [Ignavibacteriales bacterium]|nr:DUF1343 domain-containing protein [Ignavibacteriales bacterium]
VQPVRLGLALLAAIKRSHPKEMVLRHRRFDILTGSSDVRKSLENNIDPEKISATWEADLKEFGRLRSKYLCYMD